MFRRTCMCLSIAVLCCVCVIIPRNNDVIVSASWESDDNTAAPLQTPFSPAQLTRQAKRSIHSISSWFVTTKSTSSAVPDDSAMLMDNHVLLQQGVPVAPLPLRPRRFPLDDNNVTTVPQNTQMYGWTPEVYPNPLIDSARCGIDYLSSGENNFTSNMRLCDPDWVLGRSGLDDVAKSLYNFSTTFGVAADNRHWVRVVEHEEPSSNKRTTQTPPTRRKLAARGNNHEHNDESPMLLRRRLDQIQVKKKSEERADRTEEAANSDSSLRRRLFGLNIFSPLTTDSDQGNSWVMVPPVELAVATVRKVRYSRCIMLVKWDKSVVVVFTHQTNDSPFYFC